MPNLNVGPNQNPVLYARNSAGTGATYVTATNNKLDVNATFSASAIALQDGSNASIKATVASLTNANPLAVEIVDGSGNQITSFGGGTQYANGAAQATPTGTVALGWDTTNVRALATDNTGKLNLNNISGTITLPTLAATSTKQSDGSQKTQIVDGSGNVIASTSNALNVALTAGSAVIGHVVTDSGSVTNATLTAETTKVIGTVRNADGSGNLWTSNSTTYTAKFGQDSNLLGTLGTAFSTAGKVDVKAADGDVFVRQATAANLNATVVGTGTFAVQNTPASPATIFNGKTSTVTAGTRVTLAASQVVRSVTVKALAANTGTIYVGNSTVAASNGLQLAAGEAVSLDITNLNTVNIDSSVNGEGVTYLGIG